MRIDILTGARLHLGLICGTQRTGWRSGGIGIMLRNPSWQLVVETKPNGPDCVFASNEAKQRVSTFLDQIRGNTPLPPVNVTISSEIPFHTGLGSGTQLGLALAASADLAVRFHVTQDPFQLAVLANRAERSAIGTVGFREGGFLVDHGVSDDSSERRCVDRIPIPDDWRFVLIQPSQSRGLSGDQERCFFNQRVEMPEPLVKQLEEMIFHNLMPSVRNQNFDQFASGLELYGNAVGRFYAAEQGDVFAHPAIRKLVDQLLTQGVHGAAQSSWGPGICIPARSLLHAREIKQLIPASIGDTTFIVRFSEPMNVGASLRTTSHETHSGYLA